MRPARAVLALVLAASGFASACRAAQGAPPSTGRAATSERPAALGPGAPVHLSPGEEIPVDGSAVRLRFAGVVEDSRCPREVTCVWAGRAVVEIVATAGADGPERAVRLEVGAGPDGAAELFGVRFTAAALEPYPRAGEATRREDYRVRLALLPGGSR